MTIKNFSIAYFILAILEIWAASTNFYTLVFITKPLIMLSLIVFYAYQTKNKMDWQDKTMLVSFAFSLLGDVFLMLPDGKYFIFGLGSFLLTHLCYIFVFGNRYKTNVVGRLAFLIYALTFVSFLKKHLPEALFLPVLVYSFTIATMGMRAAERQTTAKSYKLVLIGAILFIISDSLIAVDKFVNPISFATILIMGTYVVAQYLIMVGFLERKN